MTVLLTQNDLLIVYLLISLIYKLGNLGIFFNFPGGQQGVLLMLFVEISGGKYNLGPGGPDIIYIYIYIYSSHIKLEFIIHKIFKTQSGQTWWAISMASPDRPHIVKMED